MSAANTRTKSYLVPAVDKAIVMARRELGPDAMLLYSRRLLTSGGQGGKYEVVFSVKNAVAASPETAAPGKSTSKHTASPLEQESAREMKKLHAQIDEIRSLLSGTPAPARPAKRIAPELAAVHARLIASEVDAPLTKEIVDRLETELATDVLFQRGSGPARLEALLRTEMPRRVGLDARLRAVVALVGPAGAGKTTSLMKLAASEVALGRSVRILSLDTPLAAAQLQAFAAELKIPFALVPTAQELPEFLEEAAAPDAAGTGLVLIDTPGSYGPAGAAKIVADALTACSELDVHLVAPGYMKAADLRSCIQKCRVFRPAKLLVTKLDETQSFGSVFSEAARANLSLSFLAHGPAVSDRLRRATLEDLLVLALDRRKTRAQVA